MITGELKNKVDAVWDVFWSGVTSNPLTVMEQITYLLFLKGLDERQMLAESKANALGKPIEDPIFPEGIFTPEGMAEGRPYEDLRWSRFKHLNPGEMHEVVSRYVFPFLSQRASGTTHGEHMAGATLEIRDPGKLHQIVDRLDAIPMHNRDTKGDVYEYMLSQIASAGKNGQFRTPRHIIRLMVEMMAPTPSDTICDPACGTCGFLVAASEYLRDNYADLFSDPGQAAHFHSGAFHGYDFDSTMLRIGSMNMQLHGIDNPNIAYKKSSLAEDHADDAERYSLVLANPPFKGSLDYETTAKDLLQVVKTKKTELLFLALFLRLMKPGGRAAVIVPDGVLFRSDQSAYSSMRKSLVEDHQLHGVISMPSGVFKPYSGVSTAILLFTKTNSGGTDHVWFYDLKADGYSLDDKRSELLPTDKLGPLAKLTDDEHAKNNLPDALARWSERNGTELDRQRTDQSFCVPKADIVANDYDLSINRYKEIVYDEIEYPAPAEILEELTQIEEEIQKGIDDLKAMLS